LSESIKVPLELNINDKDYAVMQSAAESRSMTVLDFIQKSLENYVRTRAAGGLMMTVDDLNRIRKSTGSEIKVSADVVAAAEKGANAPKGQYAYVFELDPSIVQYIKSTADLTGEPIDSFMQSMWSFILANGWLHDVNPDGLWVPFSHHQAKKLRELLDGKVTSDGIMGLVKKK
jgi:hypothetical protein